MSTSQAESSAGAGADAGGGGTGRKPTGLAACCTNFFEYETPKVVTIQNVPLGILRMLLQLMVIAFVVVYQLWYARGYQEFAEVESSVTTKVKGFSRSALTDGARGRIPSEWHYMYERVWDEADYVVPPAENGAFFVMTNVVLTPNQTRSVCPEDTFKAALCHPPPLPPATSNETASSSSSSTTEGTNATTTTTTTVATTTVKYFGDCQEGRATDLVKGHGTQTGKCVASDRADGLNVCEVQSWCPVEVDQRPLSDEEGPLITGVGDYTVFIKNSIAFPRFGHEYNRKNMDGGRICVYEEGDPPERLCPIFRLGDIVRLANGNITKLSVRGGVIGIEISWNCDLDWNFMKYCLPTYQFRILDATGWNFRHAFYHEENRRTLVKAYGLKFLLVIDGRAGKFDLKNTVIVLVTGLGLLGLSTMFCDFVLLNYSPERKKVKEKKYETVQTTSRMLESTLRIISQTSNIGIGGGPGRRGSGAGGGGGGNSRGGSLRKAAVRSLGTNRPSSKFGSLVKLNKNNSHANLDKVAPAPSSPSAQVPENGDAVEAEEEVTTTQPRPAGEGGSDASSPPISNGGPGTAAGAAAASAASAAGSASSPPPYSGLPVPGSLSPSPPPPSPPPPIADQDRDHQLLPPLGLTSSEADSSYDPLLSLMEGAAEEENVSIRFADETPR